MNNNYLDCICALYDDIDLGLFPLTVDPETSELKIGRYKFTFDESKVLAKRSGEVRRQLAYIRGGIDKLLEDAA